MLQIIQIVRCKKDSAGRTDLFQKLHCLLQIQLRSAQSAGFLNKHPLQCRHFLRIHNLDLCFRIVLQNLVEEGRKKEFYIAFLCEGVLGELVYWLREGSKITPEEFVEDLHDISLGLARKIIAEEAGTQNVIPILQNKEV